MRSQSRVFEKAVVFPCLNIKSVKIRGQKRGLWINNSQ